MGKVRFNGGQSIKENNSQVGTIKTVEVEKIVEVPVEKIVKVPMENGIDYQKELNKLKRELSFFDKKYNYAIKIGEMQSQSDELQDKMDKMQQLYNILEERMDERVDGTISDIDSLYNLNNKIEKRYDELFKETMKFCKIMGFGVSLLFILTALGIVF